MIVVADTSPINYLIWINEIDLLPTLYGMVIVPPSVREELNGGRAPEIVRAWIAMPPAWLSVRTPTLAPDAELIAAELDAGERDAILLAEELQATDLIVDDWQGRMEAERRHIHYVGTVSVLQLAATKRLVNFKDALDRLRKTNFRISQELLDRILAETKP